MLKNLTKNWFHNNRFIQLTETDKVQNFVLSVLSYYYQQALTPIFNATYANYLPAVTVYISHNLLTFDA